MTRYLGNLTYNIVTIANGATTSGAIDLQGLVLCQIQIPSAFTGAAITFSSCNDETGTYQVLYNTANTALSITVGTSRSYNIAPIDFAGCRFLKIISGSSEGSSRTIGLVTREAM